MHFTLLASWQSTPSPLLTHTTHQTCYTYPRPGPCSLPASLSHLLHVCRQVFIVGELVKERSGQRSHEHHAASKPHRCSCCCACTVQRQGQGAARRQYTPRRDPAKPTNMLRHPSLQHCWCRCNERDIGALQQQVAGAGMPEKGEEQVQG